MKTKLDKIFYKTYESLISHHSSHFKIRLPTNLLIVKIEGNQLVNLFSLNPSNGQANWIVNIHWYQKCWNCNQIMKKKNYLNFLKQYLIKWVLCVVSQTEYSVYYYLNPKWRGGYAKHRSSKTSLFNDNL